MITHLRSFVVSSEGVQEVARPVVLMVGGEKDCSQKMLTRLLFPLRHTHVPSLSLGYCIYPLSAAQVPFFLQIEAACA